MTHAPSDPTPTPEHPAVEAASGGQFAAPGGNMVARGFETSDGAPPGFGVFPNPVMPHAQPGPAWGQPGPLGGFPHPATGTGFVAAGQDPGGDQPQFSVDSAFRGGGGGSVHHQTNAEKFFHNW